MLQVPLHALLSPAYEERLVGLLLDLASETARAQPAAQPQGGGAQEGRVEGSPKLARAWSVRMESDLEPLDPEGASWILDCAGPGGEDGSTSSELPSAGAGPGRTDMASASDRAAKELRTLCVCNPAVLRVLIDVLPGLAPDLQHRVLKAFLRLTEMSARNLEALCSVGTWPTVAPNLSLLRVPTAAEDMHASQFWLALCTPVLCTPGLSPLLSAIRTFHH